MPQAARPRVLGLESVCPLVASGQWLPDMRARAGGIDALHGTPGCAARPVSVEEVEGCAAEAVLPTPTTHSTMTEPEKLCIRPGNYRQRL